MKSSLGELPSENLQLGFPGGSDSKESACKAGDPGSIPGSGRSPGVENSTLLYYSCLENSMDRGAWQSAVHEVGHKELNVTNQLFLSLKSSLVNKASFCIYIWMQFYSPPAFYLGEIIGNPLQYSCLENPMDRGAWQATVHGVARVRHDLATKPPTTRFYLHCTDSLILLLVHLISLCFGFSE